ncbi:heavy metal-binding domain-containing protein [Vibrio chagasii]|nr:heavy metal-binding domain-containing protein [Vibrio chagasii]
MIITTHNLSKVNALSTTKELLPEKLSWGERIQGYIFSGIRDFVGGRSGTYEKELKKKPVTMHSKKLERKAIEAGANAVVGVDIDYEVLGTGPTAC